MGYEEYEPLAARFQVPIVVTGFEPLDVLQSILMLVRQLNEGVACVENEFTRGVTRAGNVKAQQLVAELFELRPQFEWRGLGHVPYSGLRLKQAYAAFDAERRFGVTEKSANENKACQCPAIIRGVKKPLDCRIFGTVCTPLPPRPLAAYSLAGVRLASPSALTSDTVACTRAPVSRARAS